MLHKEIPFLRIGLPLCTGIVSGLYINPDLIILVPATILIISGFFVARFFNKSLTNLIFGFTLTLSLFICGLILYTIEKNSISILDPGESIFACTLSDYPEEREKSYRLTVKLENKKYDSGHEPVRGSMILYYKKDSCIASLLPGDILVIKCTPIEIVNRGNPNEFDYRFYMENHGIRYYAFIGRKSIISHSVPRHRNLTHKALIIREKIIGMYKERGITGERLALVAAMTLGQKNMLDPEQKQSFIKAGVMHIMAVSGLHAVILSLFVFNILFFLKRRFNILRILITILILWSFAFVTGLTPSVLRATLMFSFLQAGTLMKRPVNGINSVLASAFILILLRPSVIFDAGFLLSYSAVIYIIAFYRDFYLLVQFKNSLVDKIWQSAVVTIVAQAGTLPLTILLFNRFPTYFILTNIVIVPLSSILIVTGCLVPILFPILFLSKYLAIILNFLTGLTELLTAKAASLPYSTIENIGLTNTECILLTVTIFLISYWLLKKRPYSVIYPLVFLILFVFAGSAKRLFTGKTNELIVYNTPGSSTVGIKTGATLNLYSDTSFVRPEVIRHCAALGLKIRTKTLKKSFSLLKAGDKTILISEMLNDKTISEYKPDILILTGVKSININNRDLAIYPEALIVTSRVNPGTKFLNQNFLTQIDTVHAVMKSGAFIRGI